jgi:tRNA(Ile)-lysidine synthase
MPLKLSPYIIEHLKTYPKIWVGLSGGLDSMALLHLLSSLQNVLPPIYVIHVHHGLSPHAFDWQLFCQQHCLAKGLHFYTENIQIEGFSHIEEQARIKRYEVFSRLVSPGEALLLAHHLDDQIETFFLHALRGTGIDGLAAMPLIYQKNHFTLIRPLLSYKRQEIEEYAQLHHLHWVEDESNSNTDFYRNFLRNEVLPLIEKKWQHYRETVSHTIHACQEASHYLNGIQVNSSPLDLQHLQAMDDFEQGLILRKWFRLNGLKLPSRKMIEEIKQQMIFPQRLDHQAKINCGSAYLYEFKRHLYCVNKIDLMYDTLWKNFPNACQQVYAVKAKKGIKVCLGVDKVEIRYRKGGEVFFWKGHHRYLKKLFQAWEVPPFLRNQIPLIYVNGILKAVPGYATLEEDGDELYNILCCGKTVCS